MQSAAIAEKIKSGGLWEPAALGNEGTRSLRRVGIPDALRPLSEDAPALCSLDGSGTLGGFCSLEVLTDNADPSVFLLLTRWSDEESFRAWQRSEAHPESHELIPKGLNAMHYDQSASEWIRTAVRDAVQRR